MPQSELKIPEDRVAILIGEKGTTKRKIERQTKTRLTISHEGDVLIESNDALAVFTTTNIVKAIGRGFNPDLALTLISEENFLDIINIADITGKSKSKMTRLKSRLIGTKGKAKHTIETLTNTNLSIYGKTVAIIGKPEDVGLAREAVEHILKGGRHGNVYAALEKKIKARL